MTSIPWPKTIFTHYRGTYIQEPQPPLHPRSNSCPHKHTAQSNHVHDMQILQTASTPAMQHTPLPGTAVAPNYCTTSTLTLKSLMYTISIIQHTWLARGKPDTQAMAIAAVAGAAAAVPFCPRPVTACFLVMNLKKSRHSNSYRSHCMSAGHKQDTAWRHTQHSVSTSAVPLPLAHLNVGCPLPVYTTACEVWILHVR